MLSAKKGTLEDYEFYYKMKCEKSAVYWSGYEDTPDYNRLKEHYNRLILDRKKETEIYFITDDGCNVGYVQVSNNSEDEGELAVGISEKGRGNGYGTFAIETGLQICQDNNKKVVISYIREDNIASQKMCEKNGMTKTEVYKNGYSAVDKKDVKMYLYKKEII